MQIDEDRGEKRKRDSSEEGSTKKKTRAVLSDTEDEDGEGEKEKG